MVRFLHPKHPVKTASIAAACFVLALTAFAALRVPTIAAPPNDTLQITQGAEQLFLADKTMLIPTLRAVTTTAMDTRVASLVTGNPKVMMVRDSQHPAKQYMYSFASNQVKTNDTRELTDADATQMKVRVDAEYPKFLAAGTFLEKRKAVVKFNLDLGRQTHVDILGGGYDSLHVDSIMKDKGSATAVISVKHEWVLMAQVHPDGTLAYAEPWGDYTYTISYQKIQGKWMITNESYIQTAGIVP